MNQPHMSKKDDLKNEFPLLYQRLVESNTPNRVFISGTLKERINDIVAPLGYTLADIEQFLEAVS